MPTRIIREGILTSELINQLSATAELFYRRLMSVADDYGRYFANPAILRANCFPLQLDRYTESDVKQMLSECTATKPEPLIVIYGGKKYIQLLKFGQQTRSRSKFPQPSDGELLIKCKADDKQMCSLDVVEGVCEGVVVVVGQNGDGDGIKRIIERFKDIRPEFRQVRDIDIHNALKYGPRETWDKALDEFARDYAGALQCPDRPYKIFAGYIKRIAAGSTGDTTGKQPEIVNVRLVGKQ